MTCLYIQMCLFVELCFHKPWTLAWTYHAGEVTAHQLDGVKTSAPIRAAYSYCLCILYSMLLATLLAILQPHYPFGLSWNEYSHNKE